MAIEKVNVDNVDFGRLDGFLVGGKYGVYCDVSNDRLALGDEVQVLAAVDPDGTIWLTHVCRADLDLGPTDDELDRGKVTLRSTLIEADRFPDKLILGGTHLPGEEDESR
jgi:hypothetical protein